MKERIFIPPPMREIRLLANEPQAFKRILIMEDDPEVAVKIKNYLETRFFDVTFARSAVFALREVMEKDDFDVIICDMVRPQFSGQMFHVAVSRVKAHLCSRFIFTATHGAPASNLAFVKEVDGMMLWHPFENHVLWETIQLVLQKRTQARKENSRRAQASEIKQSTIPSQKKATIEAENLRLLHLSVNSAKKSLRIISSQSFFDEVTIKLLQAAREREVDVELFVPRRKNDPSPDAAVHSSWEKLLDAGVKIFAMDSVGEHGRIIIGDDNWLCSTDSNVRPPYLNIYQGEFTARYLRSFNKQRKNFKPITSVPQTAPIATRTFIAPPQNSFSTGFFFKLRSLFSGTVAPRL